MRSALFAAATLAYFVAGCLDTEADPPSLSALDAGMAGRGSEKPAVAPGTRSAAGASGVSSGSKTAQELPQGGSSAARSGKGGQQPMAAGARAFPVGKSTNAGGAGGSTAGREETAEMPRVPSPSRSGDLVISELMVDPKTLPDTQGEWFELYNASSIELSLRDCQIDDGAEALHAIPEPVLIEPGEYATLARSPSPGFMPSGTVALSLTNTADTLAIVCRGIEIDRVRYSKAAGFEIKPGVTLSLDPEALSAQQNDDASAWCVVESLYNDDIGTPGRANPSCHPEQQETTEEPDAGAGSDEW